MHVFASAAASAQPARRRQVLRTAADYLRVSSEMLCILTRMHVRHWWYLAPAYFHFRRIRRLCGQRTPGLLRFAFVVESPWTFYTISLWRNGEAIVKFGNLPEHVTAARWTFRHTDEIWAAEWQLSGLSSRARWGSQDLVPEDHVVLQRHARERGV